MGDILIDEPVAHVRRITFNRPAALNALTFAMYEELIGALERLRDSPDIRAVILTGAGRAFCAGHDVRAAGEPGWVAAHLGRAQRFDTVMNRLGSIPGLLRALPQPVIAAVNGVAAGAGFSFALAADLCIAARSAKFVNAFHNAGTGHEMGLSYMLPRAIGAQRAAELLLTGRAVPATEAASTGMVLRVVDDEALMDDALALADAILVNSPIGIALTKQSMWLNASAPGLEAAVAIENRAIFMSQSTEDSAEKRRAFVEKRRPVFKSG